MKFLRLMGMLLLACIVSMFVFPISFSFFTSAVNTKMILGVVGIVAYIFDAIRRKTALFHNTTVVSMLFAMVFSVWCYFSMVNNGTPDDTYATYFMSFSVWLGGAYAVCSLIRAYHGKLNLALLAQYLAFVCVAQCASAMIIDHYPGVRIFVDTYVQQNQNDLHEMGRLYGIGASLDPAGCRFSVVLTLIAHMIATHDKVTDSRIQLSIALLSFFMITVIGNMISRTTIVGAALGLVYLFIRLGTSRRGIISGRKIKFYRVFLLMLLAVVLFSIWRYATDPQFRFNLRFAFESFFNYFETGRFSSSSTDKLHGQMWIWPTTVHDWLVGTGWFGYYIYDTDIGYCRFVLYCGIIGLALFSLFFVYNATVVARKFRDFRTMSFLLLALTFIIWIKVSTDIFWIYALLFCLPSEVEEEEAQTAFQG